MKRMTMALSASMRVCFLTDIEGNWQYVRNFVRQSTCLRFRDAQERELELRDGCALVFGGDAGDKGDDTLHCYSELLRLKKQYPERVVLLVGNRDVNKIRFTSELSDSELDLHTMATEIRDGPVWIPTDKRMTLTKFLSKKALETSETCATPGDMPTLLDLSSPLLNALNTKVNRLHYMLNHTMGSDGDFERRRREIARLEQREDVSDQAVLQSFASSVDEGGVIRDFLLHGCLAFRFEGSLFVHGGIFTPQSGKSTEETSSTLGRVPGDPTVYQEVDTWIEKLNGWYQNQLQEWIDHPTWNQERTSRGGNELMNYVLPSYKHSVIMGRHLDKAGMPVALPPSVAETLSVNGIQRVIVGHTPHGTCPTVIRQPRSHAEQRFQDMIMCDTSYSDMKAADNRGLAASELTVDGDGRVEIHGVLEDGQPIAFAVNTDDSASYIGRLLHDGTRIKAKLAGQGDSVMYLVFKVENGYSYTYHRRSSAEIDAIGLVSED